MGGDLPMYLVVENATSQLEYHSITAEIQQAMAGEAAELSANLNQTMRRMEINEGWVRPDLSFAAMEAPGGQLHGRGSGAHGCHIAGECRRSSVWP